MSDTDQFINHAQAVVTSTSALVDRMTARKAYREKQGRKLSQNDIKQLERLRDAMTTARQAVDAYMADGVTERDTLRYRLRIADLIDI